MRVIEAISESMSPKDFGDLRSALKGRPRAKEIAKIYKNSNRRERKEVLMPYVISHLRLRADEDVIEAVDNMIDNFDIYHRKPVRDLMHARSALSAVMWMLSVVSKFKTDDGSAFLRVFGDHLRHIIESSSDRIYGGARLSDWASEFVLNRVWSDVLRRSSAISASGVPQEWVYSNAIKEFKESMPESITGVIESVLEWGLGEARKGEVKEFLRTKPSGLMAMAEVLEPILDDFLDDRQYSDVELLRQFDEEGIGALEEDLRDNFADMFFAYLKA